MKKRGLVLSLLADLDRVGDDHPEYVLAVLVRQQGGGGQLGVGAWQKNCVSLKERQIKWSKFWDLMQVIF